MEMQLSPVRTNVKVPSSLEVYEDHAELVETPVEILESTMNPSGSKKGPHFIEANTKEVTLEHLRYDCATPVFRDNQLSISHCLFIETLLDAAHAFFPNEAIEIPEIRVSHIINARKAEAINKSVKELQEMDVSFFYERMAFCVEIPSIHEYIDGKLVNLCFGGVRALNHENLYGKKTAEKFKIFCGFSPKVCTNLTISIDGLKNDFKAMSGHDLFKGALELFVDYNPARHLHLMESFNNSFISEHEFAEIIGKSRLYQFLPAQKKKALPSLEFGDSYINIVAKTYFSDPNFSRHPITKDLSMWNLLNLFTGANKSSYIDNFLDRALNASQLTEGIMKALQGDEEYRWFLD